MNADILHGLLISVLPYIIPRAILCIVGIIMGILFFKRSASVSLLAIGGSLVMILGILASLMGHYLGYSGNVSFKSLGWIFAASHLMSLCGLLCWLIAAFTGRRTAAVETAPPIPHIPPANL